MRRERIRGSTTMSDYKLNEEVWVRCSVRYEQAHKHEGDERYWVGNDDWVDENTGEHNQPVMPADICTLEELTEQAVKAERERIAGHVQMLIDMTEETPDRDQSRDEGAKNAYADVLHFLAPPEPPTPKEVITKVLEDWDAGGVPADDILQALASKGWKVEQS